MHTCRRSVVDNAHLSSGGTVGYASYAACLAFRLSHSASKAGNDPLVTTGLDAAVAIYPSPKLTDPFRIFPELPIAPQALQILIPKTNRRINFHHFYPSA
jgi:hypothetical protein